MGMLCGFPSMNKIMIHKQRVLRSVLVTTQSLLLLLLLRHLDRRPLLQIQYEPERRVAVEIITMQALAPQKAKPLVQLQGCGVRDFSLEHDLEGMSKPASGLGLNGMGSRSPHPHLAPPWHRWPFSPAVLQYLAPYIPPVRPAWRYSL